MRPGKPSETWSVVPARNSAISGEPAVLVGVKHNPEGLNSPRMMHSWMDVWVISPSKTRLSVLPGSTQFPSPRLPIPSTHSAPSLSHYPRARILPPTRNSASRVREPCLHQQYRLVRNLRRMFLTGGLASRRC